MDGFLSAYQALQPDARLDSFEDFLQFTFGWEDAESGPNTQVMFPGLAAAAAACPGQPGATATAAAAGDAVSADDLLTGIAGDLCPAGAQQQQWSPGSGMPGMHSDRCRSSPFAGVGSMVTQPSPQPPQQQQVMQLQQAGRVSPFARPAPQQQHHAQEHLPLPGTDMSGDAIITSHILSMQQQLQQQQQPMQKLQQQQPAACSKRVTTALRKRGQQRPKAPPAAERQASEQPEESPRAAAPKRRGRPVKVPGQYSRGYSSILRYRNKKKQWVAEMEADIAAKRELLVQLMEQQHALQHKHDALEAAIGTQNEMLSQLSSVHQSIGPASGTVAVAESLVSTAAAAEQQQQQQQQQLQVPGNLPAGDMNSSSSSLSGAAAAGVPCTHDWAGITPKLDAKLQQQRQERELHQQPQHGSSSEPTNSSASGRTSGTAQQQPGAAAADPLLLWGRFRDHIVRVGAMLAQERQAACPAAASDTGDAGSASLGTGAAAATARRSLPGTDTVDSTGYPPLPFTLGQALALWTLNRHVGSTMPKPETATAASSVAAARPGGAEQAGHRLLNLRTREYDVVAPAFWARVAAQIQLAPGQRPQLEAAWQLFASSVARLNAERQALLAKLRDADRGDTTSHVWVGAGVRRVVLPGRHARDLDGYACLADEVELNLLRGRLLVMLYTWSMFCVLDNKQGAQLCVGSWPYFPVTRAIMGNLLGVPELLEGAA